MKNASPSGGGAFHLIITFYDVLPANTDTGSAIRRTCRVKNRSDFSSDLFINIGLFKTTANAVKTVIILILF